MTTKTKSSKTRQRHSQQYKTESLALAERLGFQRQTSNLGFMKASCILGEARLVLRKIAAPWKNGFL